MPYATKQDLIDRFGETELVQLTDRTNRPPMAIDDVIVARALGDAASFADGYLGKVFALPMAAVPEVLVKVSADLARYYLHGKSADKDSPVTAAYNQALGWLKDVARGLVSFDTEPGAPEPAGGGSVKAKAADRVFTRETLRGA